MGPRMLIRRGIEPAARELTTGAFHAREPALGKPL